MNIEIENLNYETISKKIEEIKQELETIEVEKQDLLAETDSQEELERKINKLNIPNKKLTIINLYYQKEDSSIIANNPELKNKIINDFQEIIKSINKEINLNNFQNSERITSLNNELNFYQSILPYFDFEKEVTLELIKEAETVVLNSILTEENKIALSRVISKKLVDTIEKQSKLKILLKVKQEKEEEPVIVTETNDFDDKKLDEFESEAKKIQLHPEEITEINQRIIENEQEENTTAQVNIQRQLAMNYAKGIKMRFFASNSVEKLGIILSDDTLEEDFIVAQSIVEETHSYSKDMFAYYVAYYCSRINDSELSDEEVIKYRNKVEDLINEIYKKTKERKFSLNSKLEECKNLRTTLVNLIGQTTLDYTSTDDILNKIEKIEKQINEIFALDEEQYKYHEKEILEVINETKNKINLLKSSLITEPTDERKEHQIKSIVLFHKKNGEIIFEKDINGETGLVDQILLEGGKQIEHRKEASKLIEDLILLGEPSSIKSSESSISNGTEKILAQVYLDKSRTYETDMWRIRPTRNSKLRFVERKIVLTPGTTIYKQVKDIVCEEMPGVEINDNEKFNIYVNIATGLKKAEESIYTEAIKRYGDEEILRVLFKDGNYSNRHKNKSKGLKSELSSEDIEKLRKYIQESLSLYKKLNNEEGYELDFINELCGGREYGLQ